MLVSNAVILLICTFICGYEIYCISAGVSPLRQALCSTSTHVTLLCWTTLLPLWHERSGSVAAWQSSTWRILACLADRSCYQVREEKKCQGGDVQEEEKVFFFSVQPRFQCHICFSFFPPYPCLFPHLHLCFICLVSDGSEDEYEPAGVVPCRQQTQWPAGLSPTRQPAQVQL